MRSTITPFSTSCKWATMSVNDQPSSFGAWSRAGGSPANRPRSTVGVCSTILSATGSIIASKSYRAVYSRLRTAERWGCLRAENEAGWVLVPQEPDLGHTSGGKRSGAHPAIPAPSRHRAAPHAGRAVGGYRSRGGRRCRLGPAAGQGGLGGRDVPAGRAPSARDLSRRRTTVDQRSPGRRAGGRGRGSALGRPEPARRGGGARGRSTIARRAVRPRPRRGLRSRGGRG